MAMIVTMILFVGSYPTIMLLGGLLLLTLLAHIFNVVSEIFYVCWYILPGFHSGQHNFLDTNSLFSSSIRTSFTLWASQNYEHDSNWRTKENGGGKRQGDTCNEIKSMKEKF